MRIREHAELRYLQKNRPRVITKPEEMAEICVKCEGKCKASRESGLTVCGLKTRLKKERG